MHKSLPDNQQAEHLPQNLSQQEIESKIESVQSDLRGYIISLSGHSGDCDDILQETNLFLWERKDDFEVGSNFKAWAFKVAYFKAMAIRRDNIRRGEVVFSEDIAQRISAEAGNFFNQRPDTMNAMRVCLGKLSTDHLKLINVKYLQGKSLSSFALQTGKSVDAIHKSISRIRRALRSCIEKQLSENH
ncbi:sigma-70 family RNA polymerase sigma factor [Verrucomicrobiaceae bacterium N1E253]|uniref:Sigma-70 family RNA polymerase sigma factor n=1 Tax=Oceaniferula marina TaxID=2748318 RepID=A0A851GC59_9BACT|nr:sigma-70 family RNA polymerase sigma factor [Oceaniferula marina]NWK54512.1 sigma-70 family RNA polymerase sigma factor [Oceaniferula marina]